MTDKVEEKVFLSDRNVEVTSSRFKIVGGKVYAMRNISSVQVHKFPVNYTSPVVLIIVGIILTQVDYVLLGVVLIAAGAYWIYSMKQRFSVRINSNSGEADELSSTDQHYIREIVDAINEAIIYRG